ncbi:MAG: hypothetical protein K0R14_1449 [Burkholderiales bacterium]|jgi:hypothetical protein|nr:hypothetical protein [Burkholderiales bacterium]
MTTQVKFISLKFWQVKTYIITALLALSLAACSGSGGSSSSGSSGNTLTAITVTPGTQTVPMGVFVQYTATGTYANGSTQDITNQVTWGTESAENVTINSQGLAVGTATDSAFITASLNGVKGYAQITIAAATVQSITVTPSDRSIATGATQQFTATSTNSDGSTTALAAANIVWSSSSPSVATITAAGLATGVSTGSTTISATFSGGIIGSTTLTVSSVTPTSLAVTFAGGATMPTGATQQAIATVTFSDGSTQVISASQVNWSSTDQSIATIINSSGIITGIADGATAIIGSYLSVSARTVLTVKTATLTSLAVNSASPNGIIPLLVGATNKLTATGSYNPSDGTAQFSFIVNNATWFTTAPSILSISSTGIATGVAVGTPVSVRAILNGIISPMGTASPNNNTFNVIPSIRITSINVTPTSAWLYGASGLQQQFTAIATYVDGSTANITNVANWSSSVTNLATVSTAGLYSGGLATVVATASSTSGPTIISASFGTGTIPTTGSATLTISSNRVVSIAISPNVASGLVSVPSGGTLPGYIGLAYPLKAVASYSDGTNQDVTNMATWATTGSGTAVRVGNSPTLTATDGTPAAVGNKGVVYVLIAGGSSTAVTATLGGVTSASYSLASSAATTPTSIAVSPATTMPVTGVLPGTAQLQQQYKSIATVPVIGAVLPGLYDVTNCTTTTGWVSSTPGTATVGNSPNPNTGAGSVSGNAGLVTVVSTTPGATTFIRHTVGTTTSPDLAANTLTIGGATLASVSITPTPTAAPTFYMPNNTFATKVFTATGTYTGGTGAGTYDLTQLNGWTSSNTSAVTISNGTTGSGTSPLFGGGIATVVNTGTTNIGFTLGSVSANTVPIQVQ